MGKSGVEEKDEVPKGGMIKCRDRRGECLASFKAVEMGEDSVGGRLFQLLVILRRDADLWAAGEESRAQPKDICWRPAVYEAVTGRITMVEYKRRESGGDEGAIRGLEVGSGMADLRS